MSAIAPPIAVPPEWGIQKRLGDVQAALTAIATQVLDVGLQVTDIRWVWQEVAAYLLPKEDTEIRHVARGEVTMRRPHAGRLLGQAALLVRKLIRSVVPAFFHSQATIAHEALALGLERAGPLKGQPKAVPRRPDGTLGDAPGVRHTRDFLHLLERVGLLKVIERTSEKQHVLGREARTDVHVLAIPDKARGFLRELAERVLRARRAGDAHASGAPRPTSPSGAPRSPPPAARSAPVRPTSERDDPAYLELVRAHQVAHEARYRADFEAEGQPYAPALAGSIRSEHRADVAQALRGFAHRGHQRALAKGRGELAEETVRAAIVAAIVDAYMRQGGEWVEKNRHPLGGLWALDPRGNRELDVIGERVLDEWAAELEPPSGGPGDFEVDDPEEARLACAEFRARMECFGSQEPAPPVQRGPPERPRSR